MQTEQSFSDLIKNQFRYGGMTFRLIAVNVIVFLFLSLIEKIAHLIGGNESIIFLQTSLSFFTLNTNLNEFIFQPWTIVTSTFSHLSFFHLLSNMLMLYFSGQLFEQLFDGKKLLYTYILGGIFGSVFEILAHQLFPNVSSSTIIGASGSIMAIFAALAFYRPNLQVMFFGLFPIKLIILAGIFIMMDFFSLGVMDGTAHFAHIGGVVLGILSIQKLYSRNNIVTAFQRFIESIVNFIKTIFGKKTPKMKVQQGGRQANFKSDEEYNLSAKQRQEQIDKILDKISKSGYESLTKAEKDFLFKQSNNG